MTAIKTVNVTRNVSLALYYIDGSYVIAHNFRSVGTMKQDKLNVTSDAAAITELYNTKRIVLDDLRRNGTIN